MAGYAQGTPPQELLVQTLAFGVGSTLLHSGACVLNDICDIEFDKLVGKYILTPLVFSKTDPSVQSAREAVHYPPA